jgi:hypothetical protein
VRNLVAEHRFDLVLAHLAQQSGAHRDEGMIAIGAGRERIGCRRLEYRDVRHADAGLAGLLAHGLEQPALDR